MSVSRNLMVSFRKIRLLDSRNNMWRNRVVAIAYSYQQNSRPYLELLKTTESFICPRDGEKWLDLGCGSGPLVRSIWKRCWGNVRIIATDLSVVALSCAKKSFQKSFPTGWQEKIDLIQADFSRGLGKLFRPDSFDGIVAGLCIAYAEHWDPLRKRWDNQAYVQLLKDVYLVLKTNGSFVFSSNVPGYSYWLLARKSWREILLTWKLPLAIVVSSIMLYQSRWLRESAREGRFHYLPAEEIVERLRSIGFREISYTLSYAGQAWVFRALK
jgi:ubiquinone/menaquinone biosynthesis C-methylase UbiE